MHIGETALYRPTSDNISQYFCQDIGIGWPKSQYGTADTQSIGQSFEPRAYPYSSVAVSTFTPVLIISPSCLNHTPGLPPLESDPALFGILKSAK